MMPATPPAADADGRMTEALENVVLVHKGYDALLVCFGSLNLRGAAYRRRALEFSRSTSQHDISCLFLSDPLLHWYHSGVPGIASSSTGLATYLAHEARGYRHVVTFGNSMGGYAAILFAEICGFDASISFAPQTTLDPTERERLYDRRWRQPMREIHEAAVAPQFWDVAYLIASAADDRTTRHLVFHGTHDRLDAKHAHRLLLCARTDVFEVAGVDHAVAKHLRDIEVLPRLIEASKRSEDLTAYATVLARGAVAGVRGLTGGHADVARQPWHQLVRRIRAAGHSSVILCGASLGGRTLLAALRREHITVSHIVDRDAAKWGARIQGIQVLGLDDMLRAGVDRQVFVAGSLTHGADMERYIRARAEHVGVSVTVFTVS